MAAKVPSVTLERFKHARALVRDAPAGWGGAAWGEGKGRLKAASRKGGWMSVASCL
jgi:hypothetical protein